MSTRRLTLALMLATGALALVAAGRPAALAGIAPGVWDVSRSATGAAAERRCIGDLGALASWDSRGESCTRVIVGQTATSVTFHYTCAAGGFGQSKISVITPRTLKVETQGIAQGLPFETVLHARRVGDCAAR